VGEGSLKILKDQEVAGLGVLSNVGHGVYKYLRGPGWEGQEHLGERRRGD
jgi:hypothetical protein